jgi:hypothetical protein
MTPKEKADQLIEKYADSLPSIFYNVVEAKNYHSAKKCASIAVDEIIKLDIFDCNDEWSDEEGDTREYWEEVKQEIEKL